MRDEVIQLLGLRRLPGRLTGEQAAPVLGFMPHDIPVLVKAKLLRPLGCPRPNAVKFFAASEVEKCARDENWLNRATKAIYSYWAEQNRNRGAQPCKAKTVPVAA